MNLRRKQNGEVCIVLSGAAGQGIQTVEHVFTRIAKDSGFHVFATKEYMSRVRGGNNSTSIRISERPVKAYVDRIDILVPLNDNALERLRNRITSETIILGNEKYVRGEKNALVVNFEEIAESFGNKIFENSVAIGVLSGIIGAQEEALVKHITAYFSRKSEDVVKANVNAALKGLEIGRTLGLRFELIPSQEVKSHYLMAGYEAVARGAIAGGVTSSLRIRCHRQQPYLPSFQSYRKSTGFSSIRPRMKLQLRIWRSQLGTLVHVRWFPLLAGVCIDDRSNKLSRHDRNPNCGTPWPKTRSCNGASDKNRARRFEFGSLCRTR